MLLGPSRAGARDRKSSLALFSWVGYNPRETPLLISRKKHIPVHQPYLYPSETRERPGESQLQGTAIKRRSQTVHALPSVLLAAISCGSNGAPLSQQCRRSGPTHGHHPAAVPFLAQSRGGSPTPHLVLPGERTGRRASLNTSPGGSHDVQR